MTHQAFPGFSAPAAGFEVPLEMLAACHGRVQSQCDTLSRLVRHVATCGSDRPAQEAAVAIMRYFDTAARHHHDDEEQDLFPALLASKGCPDPVGLGDLIAALTVDHRELEARWSRLRRLLQQVATGHRVTLRDEVAQDLIALYQRHIAREEAELLPLARQVLSDVELDRIGLAMRARRGVSDPAAAL